MQRAVLSPADAGGGSTRVREPFAAFVLDDASRQAAITAANEQGWTGARVSDGGITGAIESLGDMPTPRVLLVDISDSNDPVRDINRLAEVCVEGTHVVALGGVNEVDLFRRLMHAGVDDYLVKPVDSEVLNSSLTRLMQERAAAPSHQGAPGRIVVLIGARGGIGATALISNLAWLSAEVHGQRTAVVDLDLQFGSAALAFDVEPGQGLADALNTPARIDDLLVERAAVKVADKLSVFCAEVGLEAPASVNPAAIEAWFERLRTSFECIFVDLPRNMVSTSSWLIGAADCVLVVINHAGAPGHSEIKRADMEKALDAKVDFEIPDDRKAASESALAGKPMVVAAGRGKASQAMRALARRVCPQDEGDQQPLWRRLLGRKG